MAAKTKKTKAGSKKKGVGNKKSQLFRLFDGAGFEHIQANDIHVEFKNNKSEIDYIFVHKNLIVLCEETTRKDKLSEHFSKKVFFWNLVLESQVDFLNEYKVKNIELNKYIIANGYEVDEYIIKIVYFSEKADVDDGYNKNSHKDIKVLSKSVANYFLGVVKSIERSAKYEFLKYLDVKLSEIGENIKSGRSNSNISPLDGFFLPTRQTNYPDNYKIVSFYADPDFIIKRAYVLRREGWESQHLSYQRFLKQQKLQSMRNELAKNNKVYINNIIATLPSCTALTDIKTGKAVTSGSRNQIKNIKIDIPEELGIIGIIDGQHRVFSYYEGDDQYENEINKIRKRQNLLVTAIIFPDDVDEDERISFEAQLFLEINENQTKVLPSLRQEIEALIHPTSPTAISQNILRLLAKNGVLKGMVQDNIYDSKKIKTSSLAKYVLNHSFSNEMSKIKQRDKLAEETKSVVKNINKLLLGVKENLPAHKWNIKGAKNREAILGVTVIGGFILLAKKLQDRGEDIENIDYKKKFKKISGFDFSRYRSSRWNELSDELLDVYFK